MMKGHGFLHNLNFSDMCNNYMRKTNCIYKIITRALPLILCPVVVLFVCKGARKENSVNNESTNQSVFSTNVANAEKQKAGDSTDTVCVNVEDSQAPEKALTTKGIISSTPQIEILPDTTVDPCTLYEIENPGTETKPTTIPSVSATPRPTHIKTDPTTGPTQGVSDNEVGPDERIHSDENQAEWIPG